MGWFAITPVFHWEVLLLCGLIAMWLPLHVWSVMIAHREDYISAGLTYFPMSRPIGEAIKILPLFSLVLGALAITLYFIGGFAQLYLIAASLLTIIMVYATVRLVISHASGDAWKLYKLSSFPYLGLIFLAMCLDMWLL
jgi:protoheme IX farnesyltransferase